MSEPVQEGFMAFIADGIEGVGAVRKVSGGTIIVYIENVGEFTVPRSAISDVHSQKVMLNPDLLDKALLTAIKHRHDAEDPDVGG